MSQAVTEAEKIRRLPWLIGGDAFNIMFVLLTFSGSVFVLFLDELGLNIRQIGFMLALVPFAGVLAPLVAPISTRFGYKRIFVLMRALRNIPMALLLFTPLVLQRYGQMGAFRWVAGIIIVFALMRAIGETGSFAWRKEIVPDSIRGKFTATNSMVTTVASLIVVLAAGYVLEAGSGLPRFSFLIGAGCVFGLISVLFFTRSPSENKSNRQPTDSNLLQGMWEAMRNRTFMLFLLVLGLATIGGQSVISFIPLFMKDEVGLTQGIIVLLSIGTYMGALITSYFWGWAADRYSSKPVMQASLILMLLLPISWLLLPRHDPASVALAMAIAFIMGIATLAWQISWIRYLYINAVPAKNRSAYLALYFACFSLAVGIGPLVAGRLLTASAGIVTQQIWLFNIDVYTPLFLLSGILIIATLSLIPRLQTDANTVTFRRFAGMFLRGNPVRAMRLLVQYNQSGDEMTRVTMTEQMGDIGNLLNAKELLEALEDPIFSVRYEAIHSIGRMPDNPELIEALVDVLQGPEPELGMITARALGRIGDASAIPALRQALSSRYDLIAVNSARALAQLGDTESVPALTEKLRSEPNRRLQAGYASALGRLGAVELIPDLFVLLCQAKGITERGEFGLAIARLIGDERFFLQHWKSFRENFNTASAQAMIALEKPMRRRGEEGLANLTDESASYFATGELRAGGEVLAGLLRQTVEFEDREMIQDVLLRYADALNECETDRPDLILLSMHALDAVWNRST